MYQVGGTSNGRLDFSREAITNSSQTFTAPENGYIFLKTSMDDGSYDFYIDGVRFEHVTTSEWYDMTVVYEIYPILKGSIVTIKNINSANWFIVMYFAPMAK